MAAGEIARALSLLFEPGQVIEVRAITEEGTASGYFDDPEALAIAVDPLDAAGTAGIYVTLNEVNPALLSRRANRVKMRLSKKDATTADSDIIRRRWFPVDIDPVRPSGVSSTDEEHQAALVRAAEIAAYLGRERGWPAPVLADSGNGAHLLYRIDLPNEDGSRDLVKRALEALDMIFSDRVCTVDTANFNAARIWKLYGTTSRKGDHTGDRPHRRGTLLDAPDEVAQVSRELLEDLAASLPVPPGVSTEKNSTGRGTAIDLRSWLISHGIGIAAEKPYKDGTLYVLDECPFSGAHRDGAFAIQFGSGAIHAGCHHNSCGGGGQRWPELREKYEPWEKRGGPARTTPGQTRADRRDPGPGARSGGSPPINLGELPGREEALATLQHGDPKRAMLNTFALDHEGDEVVAECMIMSLASRSVLNTNGLHVSVTGESGKGKSHAFATMLRQVPARFRLEGAMSNKALFYLEDLQPGSVIVLDDRALSEDMAEILKGVTTSFRRPFIYRTVSKDRRSQVCTIPERCIWWVAKVEGVGDDQVFNRMLTCWIDDSHEQDARVLARILARDQEMPGQIDEDRPEVQACRAMWEIVGQQRFHVMIPFATRIRFQESANRRNPEMLLDLIKANTMLRFMQREQQRAGSVASLTATLEDFKEATRLYSLLNGTAGGQETKLTKREADLLAAIRGGEWPEFTIPMLQKATGWSNGVIYKCIHGHVTHGKVYSGLLEKCPAIAFCDRTVVTGEEGAGVSMRRRTNAYTFDRDLFKVWCGGGAVWIDDDPDLSCNPATDFNNPATTLAGFENDAAGSDSLYSHYNNNIFLCTQVSCNKSQGTQHPEDEGARASACDCDPGIVAGQPLNPAQSPAISETVPQDAPLSLQQSTSTTEKCRNSADHPTDPSGLRPRVRAADYKPLDMPERTACYVCGRTWSDYVEKLTEERRHREDKTARRICKGCFQSAKRKAQKAAVFLPGTFDVTRAERLTTGIGRCTVCNLDRAVYLDRAAGTALCEYCYQRAMQAQGRGEVVG
jgi:hypothetical protein